jgi:O-antigen/teichoic acid export membrane protein
MPSLDVLTAVVSILVVLSMSAERLVEIVKGLSSFLSKENEDAQRERWRKVILQVLAVAAGILTTVLALPLLPAEISQKIHLDDSSSDNYIRGVVVLGFLTSGGSGLWNSVLGYLKGIKDIKQVQATEARTIAAGGTAADVRAKLLHGKETAVTDIQRERPEEPAGIGEPAL